jgi:hypothetical protein
VTPFWIKRCGLGSFLLSGSVDAHGAAYFLKMVKERKLTDATPSSA